MTDRRRGKITVICLSSLFVLIILAFALVEIFRDKTPNAILHQAGQVGYIVFDDAELDVDLRSENAFVYDVKNDRIIFRKGEEKIVYPASTTKLLTALYALEIMEPDKLITPSDELELVASGSSIAYIKAEHTLTLEMLIEGMIIPSGNDAAYAIAAAGGRTLAENEDLSGKEAVSHFMEKLNEYGKSIGLCGTHFTVPDGYSSGEHYSTVEDMVIISKLALENEIISKYMKKQKDSVVYASGHTNEWKNTNEMLDKNSEYYSPYVTGMKTGSLNKNYCFICSVDDGEDQYIIGLFGADFKNDRFEDALRLIELLY